MAEFDAELAAHQIVVNGCTNDAVIIQIADALNAAYRRGREDALDAVWSALGITTVPVGMTAAAEVAKLKERTGGAHD